VASTLFFHRLDFCYLCYALFKAASTILHSRTLGSAKALCLKRLGIDAGTFIELGEWTVLPKHQQIIRYRLSFRASGFD
jgi:hypothetical protein